MLLSLDRRVDEEMLSNLFEGQLERSLIIENGLLFYH